MERVNHPKHYNSHPSGVECIEIVKHHDFCIGNAIKYLWRAGLKEEEGMEKDEKAVEDLRKAIFYIEEEIKMMDGAPKEGCCDTATDTTNSHHTLTCFRIGEYVTCDLLDSVSYIFRVTPGLLMNGIVKQYVKKVNGMFCSSMILGSTTIDPYSTVYRFSTEEEVIAYKNGFEHQIENSNGKEETESSEV